MKSRSESIQIAQNKEFDLIIIGGGITGAGIAQNAALHGLSTLLVEKDDFASGTSSKTTKLIHGGLRYLEQFEFKLTAELCQERAVLSKLAPHLVKDIDFVLPFQKNKFLFSLKARLGLTIYDLLSLTSSIPHRHSALNANKTFRLAPAIANNDISGSIRFSDCQTDDSRIVLAVVKSACDNGALAINYMKADSFMINANKIQGVNCYDYLTGQTVSFSGKVCVNATGVWSDEVCQLIAPQWRKRITASKGIHIIVPASAFETNTGLFLPTDDGRYVFVVPWHSYLMIGTTDNAYSEDIDHPIAKEDEIDYLLSVVNRYTNTHKLKRSDITATFAGLRPLVNLNSSNGSDTNTASMSREHIIFEAPGGLICVNGGKLTSYRLMAQEIMAKVFDRIQPGTDIPDLDITKNIMLGGFNSKEDFLTKTASITAYASKQNIEPAIIEHLIANYGSDAQLVIEIVERTPSLKERICSDFPFIMAEIPFCITCEMTVSLQDLLFRRLRLGILHFEQCLEVAPKVAYLMQTLLNWDEKRTQAELSAVQAYITEQLEPLKKDSLTHSVSQ